MLKLMKKQQIEEVKTEETKGESQMGIKGWSLKKKVLVGVGVLGTALVGVLAYGKGKQDGYCGECEFEGEDYDEDEDDEFNDFSQEEIDRNAELGENEETQE